MHFAIAVYGNQLPFTDVVLPCYFALTALGWKCSITMKKLAPNATNIIFGANGLNPKVVLPKNSIIYDFEQLSSSYYTDGYINHMKSVDSVWEYSKTNAAALKERHGLDTTYVFPGYVPEMSCLTPRQETIDLLFYGRDVPRRLTALDAIRQQGIEPYLLRGIGAKRDMCIASAKVVLNIHALAPANLEIARLGFLWANQKAVLCEDCPEWGVPEGLEEACLYVPYDKLADAAGMLQKRPSLREGIAKRGYEAFRAKPLADILEKVVGRPVQAVPGTILPCTLHVGAGQDFLPHCLNVDANPLCHPDIVLDMGLPLAWDTACQTQRFGDIVISPGMFDRIIASNVLAQARDLVQTMRNFLDLLKTGGELDITVPHDLSHNAWQNPYTLRTFNEQSWQHFCEMHWSVGWRDFCFEIADLKLKESAYGKKLLQQGVTMEEVMHTPRAVDHMRVILRKRETTPEEKQDFDLRASSVYKKEYRGWCLAPQ